jgi:hypothetical protein
MKHIYSLTLDPKVVKKIDEICEKTHRSRSAQIELILREYILKWEVYESSKPSVVV